MRWLALPLALAGILAVDGAAACLPPPADWVPPTDEERIREAVRWSGEIVYGVLTRGSNSRHGPRLRVLHVYKGSLRPGQEIALEAGWGLNPPICAGMIGPPPPVDRGARLVVLFNRHRPQLNYATDQELELMFRLGLIAPGPHDRAGARSR